MPVPDKTRTLVLNDDYVPLNSVHWKRGIKRLFPAPCLRCDTKGWVYINGKKLACRNCNGTGILPPATPVEYYNAGYVVRDGRGNEHLIPAVIANAHHVRRKYRKVPFSKANILRRDGYTCQFCGKRFPAQDLTMDHVIPRSMWNGSSTPTCWSNIVAACKPCNLRKANQTPTQAQMPLKKWIKDHWVQYSKPKAPTSQEISLGLTYRNIPEEWEIYVSSFRKSAPSG